MPDVTVNVPMTHIDDLHRKASHQWGDLFCWCVQNLPKFPPIEGEWIDEVKRRLAQHADHSAASPDCRCRRCLDDDWEPGVDEHPIPPSRRYMVVCQTCGNKRCPHAEWHGYRCTGSNEPEQVPQPAVTINHPLADLIFSKCGLTQQQAVRVAEVLLGEGEWSWPKSKIDAVAEATRVYSLHLKEKDAELTALREQLAEARRERSDELARDHSLQQLAVMWDETTERKITALRSQLAGVQGALMDAGDVLAIRTDGDYGASVREVVEQRDAAREQVADAGARWNASLDALIQCQEQLAEAQQKMDAAREDVAKCNTPFEDADPEIHVFQQTCDGQTWWNYRFKGVESGPYNTWREAYRGGAGYKDWLALREQVTRLEQERDAAREDVAHLALLRNDMLKDIAALREQLAEAQRECDRWKESAEGAWHRLYATREIWTDDCDKDTTARAQAEADEHGVPVSVNVHGQTVWTAHPKRLAELQSALTARDEEVRRLRESLVLRETCAQCGSLFIEDERAPHCLDCIVDEDHEEAWLERRAALASTPPPRTYVGDGKPLPSGVWYMHEHDGRPAAYLDGPHSSTEKGRTYTFVGPVPEEEGK